MGCYAALKIAHSGDSLAIVKLRQIGEGKARASFVPVSHTNSLSKQPLDDASDQSPDRTRQFRVALTSLLDRGAAEIRASDLTIEGLLVDIIRVFDKTRADAEQLYRIVQHQAYTDRASALQAVARVYRDIGIDARVVSL